MFHHAGEDRPWGWWLRVVDGRLQDADGRTWRGVREAFWEGRLGMPSAHLVAEQQEMLLRVLNAVDARRTRGVEDRDDLFGGDLLFWRFYMTWLGSIGLLETRRDGTALDAPLGEEGRAVLLMLRATREPVWIDLPMRNLVEAVARAERDAADDARETALRAFERGVTPMRHIFARERVDRARLVTLTGLDSTERMPVRRRLWSASFVDDRPRDDLFGWFAERVHRWEDWGDLARSGGARELTAHLLALLVAHPVRRGGALSDRDGA